MGLNLRRERFDDWLKGYGPESRAAFLNKLEAHVGHKIDIEAWQIEDDAYPRVGSYTSYGVFLDCLWYVTRGDYGNQLEDNEDLEHEALAEFRKLLDPAFLNMPYAAHFLESGDSDTIFVPLLFDTPFAYDDRYVASLPGAIIVLEAFAAGLQFDLDQEEEPEFENGQWHPVSTAKNVAAILHRFLIEKQDACVEFA